MNYRSIKTLNRQLVGWLSELPRDIDLIVGVPRSGLLAASILALHLNRQLTDVDGLLEGRLTSCGRSHKPLSLLKPRNVLIVDDSVNEGGQLLAVRQQLAAAQLPHRLQYAAVYVKPGSEHLVDFFCERLKTPRLFEWNLVCHPILLTSCLDIDGVLCEDPRPEDNDDGERYEEFLRTTKPLMIPTVPVGWLVTNRLEKYRGLTEAWLAKHGVRYIAGLVMMDLPNKATRIALQAHSSYKAAVYKAMGANLFIESSASQAEEIATLAGKHVLCMETREMVEPKIGASQQISQQAPYKIAVESERVDAPETEQNNQAMEWIDRLGEAIRDTLMLIPPGETFILVDEGQWGLNEVFAGRRLMPFLERDGRYWGTPPDDDTAVQELERLRSSGARFLVFGWTTFWWLEYYEAFHRHLRATFRCVLENDRLVVFDLTCSTASQAANRDAV